MQVHYDSDKDLLYLRFDDRKQPVTNQRINDTIVLDIGEDNKIIGIEILEASECVTLDRLLPVKFHSGRIKTAV